MADYGRQMNINENNENKRTISLSLSDFKKPDNSKEKIKEYKQDLKNIQNLAKEKKRLEKEIAEAKEKGDLKLLDQLYKQQTDNNEKLGEAQLKADKDRSEAYSKAQLKTAAAVGDALKENAAKALENFVNSGISNIKSNLETIMDSFLENQESIAYNLNGSGNTFKLASEKISSSLAGTGIVKQEKVYENLNKLVEKGIIRDVEQQAFLQTLSEDLGMTFDLTNGSLIRLVNLQNADLYENRMAIQDNLKTFLNQNYQTSQYIKEGFENVSEALIEAQSIMSASSAMELESSIQKWLGSLSSAGMSSGSVNSLAQALGQLGSGDISSLSNSSMQTLLIMGAEKVNMSYAEMLNNGLTSETANSLLSGITSVLSEVGSNSSNIVKSELARILGVSVSDIVAASTINKNNNGLSNLSLGTDISTFLGSVDDYLYTSTKLNNLMKNFIYGWATDIADNDFYYTLYKVTDTLGNIASTFFEGTDINLSFLGNGVTLDMSTIVKNAGLLTAVPALLTTAIDSFANLVTGLDADSIYNRLSGSGGLSSTIKSKVAGLLMDNTRSTGSDTSGSLILNTSTDDIASSTKTSALSQNSKQIDQSEETYNTTDIYKLLTTIGENMIKLPDGNYNNVISKIDGSKNTVKIDNVDTSKIENATIISAMNIQNIYQFMMAKWNTSSGVNFNKVDTSSFLSNNPLEWKYDLQQTTINT